MAVQQATAHIVGDQQKAQKALGPSQKERAKNLEEANLLKVSPKSRWKVCKGEAPSILLGPVFQPVFVYYQWSCNLSYRNFIHDCGVVYTLLSPWEPPELGFMPICGESKRHLES